MIERENIEPSEYILDALEPARRSDSAGSYPRELQNGLVQIERTE